MKLSEYGSILESYCYKIENGKVLEMNFTEYKDKKQVRVTNFRCLPTERNLYEREDFLFEQPVVTPDRIRTVQYGCSVSPSMLIDRDDPDRKRISRYDYYTVDSSQREVDDFFIDVSTPGSKLFRKIVVDRNSTAFHHPDLSIVQIYRKKEDGLIDFKDEHDTVYLYPEFVVSDTRSADEIYTRKVMRGGEIEEYVLCNSFSPMYDKICDTVITKNNTYKVKYNFLGMIASVTEGDLHGDLYSRYEMIDEEIHIAHSIYPYLGGDQPQLHIFPFGEIWVHDEAVINGEAVEYLSRTLFWVSGVERLLSCLRDHANAPIIESEDERDWI